MLQPLPSEESESIVPSTLPLLPQVGQANISQDASQHPRFLHTPQRTKLSERQLGQPA
jgi:hypothetical protein